MQQKTHLTPRETVITCLAYEVAYIQRLDFTVQQFAAWFHMPENRILRGALNQMVLTGKLAAERKLGQDGRYRKVYRKLTNEELDAIYDIPF